MKKYYDDEYPPEEKYLYLILFAPGYTKKFNEPIRGNTWLQKQVHVLSKTIKNLGYEFDEHNFGAFSAPLGIVQIQNKSSGLIEQPPEDGPIRLTEKGLNAAKKIWQKTSFNERNVISQIKEFFNDMNYWELISFSYSTFPETTLKSEIRTDFQKHRINAAINLFKRKKLSLSKAIKVAGISEEEFVKLLKKRGISPYSLDEETYKKSLDIIEGIT
ncbi:MAG: hypothetical protein GWN01_16195 [Nitrosopumilaceae archaeon]|nr:UPF0175 family protein [Nitrosopumilaceae archaeon]NIU02378.1 UPF0175 family protein [Nitrosopumilaceae archaeon]NIU88835.1 hypothetical protein [Nitrosopumilaceae archaeon]NIV66959.1 hypothetical protein [Nitrosopumilaceae archaeon]NIX62979.1 hypothetical protein [Nitrosopumilaceae archaeon]